MAVTGIREMSTLATPPEDRLPVLTYVGAYEDAQVTAAVRRELLRGGQVFYVHNRVQDISSIADKIHTLVPRCTSASPTARWGRSSSTRSSATSGIAT